MLTNKPERSRCHFVPKLSRAEPGREEEHPSTWLGSAAGSKDKRGGMVCPWGRAGLVLAAHGQTHFLGLVPVRFPENPGSPLTSRTSSGLNTNILRSVLFCMLHSSWIYYFLLQFHCDEYIYFDLINIFWFYISKT